MVYRIMAAIDNSNLGREVFESALTLASYTRAQLNLVHVLSPDEEGCPDVKTMAAMECPIPGVNSMGYTPGVRDDLCRQYQRAWEVYVQRCQDRLQTMAAEATGQGITTQVYQKLGSPNRTICQTAKDLSIQLVVIGRRRHNRIEQWLQTGVSHYVLQHAPCSVLVVREGSQLSQPQLSESLEAALQSQV